MKHLRNQSASSTRLAFCLILLFLIPIATPLVATSGAQPTGRAAPDFSVSLMTMSGAGSIDRGTGIIVEPAEHDIRVVVRNTGDVGGSASLQLVHKGSPTAGEYIVTTISLGNIPALTTSNPIIIPWTATTGDDQTLFARVSGNGDSNPANNEQRKDFDVKNNHSGISVSDTVPTLDPGETSVGLTRSVQTINASVRNNGVKNISSVMQLTLTEQANPSNSFVYYSNTQTLQSGSLFAPSSPKDLTLSFDPSALSGLWTLEVKILFNGTLWTDDPTIATVTVRLSNYTASLSSLGDRSIEPGQTGTLTFLLKNTGGLQDSYRIDSITTNPINRNWADVSSVGSSTAALSPGATTSIGIPVTVPLGENRSNASVITITLLSIQDGYTLVTTAVVQAGESYIASIEMPSTVTELLPGDSNTIMANVTNDGNVGGEFTFDCGLSVAAINWVLDIQGEECNQWSTFINRSVTVQIPINVKVPPIKSPLDPGEFNLAGQPLQVWLQVRAAGGGLPTQASAGIEVLPTIVVDPGLPVEELVLTEEDVIAARNGQGLEDVLGLNVEVRHNLFADIDETLSADIEVSGLSFLAANTGGFSEAGRWSAVVSPPELTGLKPGDTSPAILALQGPDDDYPLAGTITLSVTVTPALGGVHAGSGVTANPVTRNLSIVIPSVLGAEILEDGPVDVQVGVETAVAFPFANIGNDLTSYRLRLADVPDDWIVQFNGTSDTIDNLSADVADFPATGSAHQSIVELLIQTDPYVPANSIVPLTITIEERDTGASIGEHILPVRVGELRNGTLFPLTQHISVDPTDFDEFKTIKVSNTGNAPTTYYVWIDDALAGDVIFELDSNPSMLVAPGYDDIIKISVIPTAAASADQTYEAVVWVADSTGAVNMSANITANITKSSDIRIDAPLVIGVTPGQMTNIEFNVTNIGNLQESILIMPSIEGNWSTDVTEIGMTLQINQTITGQIVVSVPSLGGEESLMDGSVHNLTLAVYDASTSDFKTSYTIQLRVGALFALEAEAWPAVMEFYRQGTRTWEVALTNTGNRDVEVNVGYSVNRAGLDVGSSDWAMVDGAPTTLYLPVGVPITHIFSIEALNFEPDLSLQADFKIYYDPVDEAVQGNASYETNLVMSRFFSTGDIILRPEVGDPPIDVDITYSHIPNGQALSAAYEIELCGANRILDFAALNLNDADYPWEFKVVLPDANNTEVILPINAASCTFGTQGESSRISLPTRSAWDTSSPLQISVNAPERGKILSGDGWDLTFRLYHPTENNNYSTFDEETFSFQLDVFADPLVESLEVITIEEGEEFDLLLTVTNAGTATALGVDVALVCPTSTILSGPLAEPMIGILGPGESVVLNWRIQPDSIDWWEQSEASECTATVDAFYMDKNVVGNDVRTIEMNIESSSPGVSTSFIALIICFLASIILLRLTGQNEKFRLMAVYAGVLGFGFSFHVLDVPFWGIAVLIATALWIWRMSWSSAEEFKLIHEDYQRARRGVSTLYTDHFDALKDSRRQLSVILAVPVLGFIAVILGLPPQLYTDQNNMVSLLVYITIVMLGVWLIILRADRAYGNLYGRLTDVEVKATRIERDLGDPARLFNELAGDGLNLDEIFGDVSSNATVGALVGAEQSQEEVNDDVQR